LVFFGKQDSFSPSRKLYSSILATECLKNYKCDVFFCLFVLFITLKPILKQLLHRQPNEAFLLRISSFFPVTMFPRANSLLSIIALAAPICHSLALPSLESRIVGPGPCDVSEHYTITSHASIQGSPSLGPFSCPSSKYIFTSSSSTSHHISYKAVD
jgi:hypothetical protein